MFSLANNGHQDRDERRLTSIARGLSIIIGAYALAVSLTGLGVQMANPKLITLYPDQLDPIHAATVSHGIAAVLFVVLSVFVSRCGAHPILPRLLLVLMPGLLLVSADRILNVVRPPPAPLAYRNGVFVPHPRRGWTHDPLSSGLQDDVMTYIDRYGMRVRKADWHRVLVNAPRILFLGDSVTFGYNVSAGDGYVEQFQSLVRGREGASDFIAMNGGTISATPRQELDWLTHEGADVNPDLVVVQVCMNDITYMLHPAVLAESESDNKKMIADTNEAPYWSAIMRLAHDWGRRREYGGDLQKAAEFIATENFEKLLDETQSATMWEAWDRATGDWESMVAFCRSRKIPVAFMIVPLNAQIGDREVSSEPQKRIRAFAARRGVPCLDLLPILRKLHLDQGIPLSELYSDYTHPSPNGHRIVARELLRFLTKKGLLNDAESRGTMRRT